MHRNGLDGYKQQWKGHVKEREKDRKLAGEKDRPKDRASKQAGEKNIGRSFQNCVASPFLLSLNISKPRAINQKSLQREFSDLPSSN